MKPVYYTPDEVGQQDLFSLVDNVKEDRTRRTCCSGDAGFGRTAVQPH